MSAPTTSTIHGEPAWRIESDCVRAWLTPRGGQLAPVEFDIGADAPASPYSLAPWQPADCAEGTPALLAVLRGDFFCLPFGESKATPHPHGATANLEWSLDTHRDGFLAASIHDLDLGATVRKEIILRPGETALYQRHIISGLEGDYSYGHHPILHIPDGLEPCAVRTSAIRFGQVLPVPFEKPELGGYQALKPGARFDALDRVSALDGSTASLAEYPARAGFEDLVLFAQQPSPLAWTAVHFPGYVWVALKNTDQFPATLFWMSNGGRHMAPWNGRHRRRIGIEDVCSYFHLGLEESRRDLLAGSEIPTTRRFSADAPTDLRHIQFVQRLPEGFGALAAIEPEPSQTGAPRLRLRSETGNELTCAIDHTFLSV